MNQKHFFLDRARKSEVHGSLDNETKTAKSANDAGLYRNSTGLKLVKKTKDTVNITFSARKTFR